MAAHLDADVFGLLDAGLKLLRKLRVALHLEGRQSAQGGPVVGHEVLDEVVFAFAVHKIADVVDLGPGVIGDLGDAHVHSHAVTERLHDETRAAVGDDGSLLNAERDLEIVLLLQEPPASDDDRKHGQPPEEPSTERCLRRGHGQRAERLAKPRFLRK